MKFVFLIYHDERTLDALPPKEMQALVDGALEAETKEQLGGFFLVEAKDIGEACAVAARFPPARLGTIEVRPVQELAHS